MHKTLYVDVDEEITSIIDRIRLEEASEIFLVVPKQAMLTQGVINLKLLKKEIEKIGKSVMIATSDVHAKKVIERLGIKIKEISQEIEQNEESEPASVAQENDDETISMQATDEAIEKISETKEKENKKIDIGSSNFFDGPVTQESLSTEMDEHETTNKDDPKITKVEKKDPVQGQTPNFLSPEDLRRDLYAKKTSKIQKPQSMQRQIPVSGYENSSNVKHPALMNRESAKRPAPSRPATNQFGQSPSQQSPNQQFSNPHVQNQMGGRKVPISSKDPKIENLFGEAQQESYRIKPSKGLGFGKNVFNDKAANFFSGKRVGFAKQSDTLEQEKNQLKREIKKENSKGQISLFWKLALPVLIVVLALGGLAFWTFENYPKVTVSVFPKQKETSKEIKVIAGEFGEIDYESNKIPGNLVEVEIEKTMNFDATGQAFESDDGKARGKVKIYNYFSSSAQPLVKTTRVLSKEKKLFRLTSDATVPGMNGEEPGVVEVGVIADEPGEDYNILPTSFTIEGFKGNPKYEKFEVRSEDAMGNGGEPDSNKKLTVVTAQDLENARIETAEAFEDSLKEEMATKLDSNQQTMIDTVEKKILSATASHKIDAVANQFSYTIKQQIKAVVFDSGDVSNIASKTLQDEIGQGYLSDGSTGVTFKKGIADFEAKTLTMYVNAEMIAWPQLDHDSLALGIAGKSEEDIKIFLTNYPQIEKVEISVVPSWLTTIPVSRDKIEIKEVK